jgi:hypothetical protein
VAANAAITATNKGVVYEKEDFREVPAAWERFATENRPGTIRDVPIEPASFVMPVSRHIKVSDFSDFLIDNR